MSHAEPNARHYLSVYMAPPDATALACTRHDHCAALWRESGDRVELQRYWEFERVTGTKHHRVPLKNLDDAHAFLDSLLVEEGLTVDDLDGVWGTPGLETDREYASLADGTELPVHSLSHVFGVLLLDWRVFREETVVTMAMDLAPDWTLDRARVGMAYAGCVSVRGEVTLFPVESPGPLWHVVRERFGLEEGTLMALASATTCEVALPEAVLDRLFTIEHWNPAVSIAQAEEAIGAIVELVERAVAAPDARTACGYDDRFDRADNVLSAVMKVIDTASTIVVERNLERIGQAHDLDFSRCYLGMSGGYALNCPGNTRIMDRHGFRAMLAPPCVNDGGQALGLGLMALHARGTSATKSFRFPHAYLGRERLDVDRALEAVAPFVTSVGPRDLDQVLDDIAAGPIAWAEGASEVGPRALGHRSILGDPADPATKDALNRIKGRQWWRPVAPIVLADEVSVWFETERTSPYMLEAVRCRPDRAGQVPAVVHLDGTARLQTIAAADDPLLHELLVGQHRRTGIPMLCNTSLNDKGEPIIDEAAQVLNFCIRKGLPVAYVDGRRIVFDHTATAVRPTEPEPRRSALFDAASNAWPETWATVTGLGIPAEAVFLAGWSPEIRERLLLATADERQAKRFTRLITQMIDHLPVEQRSMLKNWVTAFGPDSPPGRDGHADLDLII